MTSIIHVAVEPNLKDTLSYLAERDSVPMSWVIRRILRESCASIKPKPSKAAKA